MHVYFISFFLIQQTYEHKYSGDMCLCRIYMQTIYVQRSFQFWTANLIAKLCSSCGNACPFFQSTCCLTSHPAVSLVVRVQTSSRMCKWWWISWERTQCLGWMLSPWHIKHKLVFLRPIWMIQNGWSTSYDLERLHVVTSEPHTKFITRTGEGLIPTVPYLKCLTFPHSPTLHREVFPLFPLDFSQKITGSVEVPIQLPIGKAATFKGVFDLVEMKSMQLGVLDLFVFVPVRKPRLLKVIFF